MANVKYVQTNTLYLAGSGVIIGATSLTLTSFADIYGNVLTMTDFGAKGYGTLEPDTTNEEAFTFTGITANANGTYTLTGVSTALAKSPYTETSSLARAHSGGTKVVITDSAVFWSNFGNKTNDEVLTGQWSGITPVNPLNLATKAYVDSVAGGVATTTQIIVPGTAGATLAVGNLVYFDVATGRWKLADSATSATLVQVLLGIAQGAGTNGIAISGGVLIGGNDSTQTGLSAGSIYYASTSGTISSTAGTTLRAIGIANSTTTLYFNPEFFYQPPTAQTYTPAGGGTATLDLSKGNVHFVTMPAGNVTIALSNPSNTQAFEVAITQDSVGSRTVTWFTTIRWTGGSAPTLTTTANKRDTFLFQRTGSGTYDGYVIGVNI